MGVDAANSAACFNPSHSGHIDVKQHCVIVDHSQTQQGLFSVAGLPDHEPQGSQGLKQALPDSCIILYDEHIQSLWHVSHLLCRSGQRKEESSSCMLIAIHPCASLMCFCYALDHRKTDSCA